MERDPVEAARAYLEGLARLHTGDAEPDAVDWLLRRSPPIRLAAGEEAIRQGEPAEDALLVVDGRLVVLVRPESAGATPEASARIVGEVGPWDVIGEAALFATGARRSATVRALRPSTLLPLRRADLLEGTRNPVVAAIEFHLVHALAWRIRATNRSLVEARAAGGQP